MGEPPWFPRFHHGQQGRQINQPGSIPSYIEPASDVHQRQPGCLTSSASPMVVSTFGPKRPTSATRSAVPRQRPQRCQHSEGCGRADPASCNAQDIVVCCDEHQHSTGVIRAACGPVEGARQHANPPVPVFAATPVVTALVTAPVIAPAVLAPTPSGWHHLISAFLRPLLSRQPTTVFERQTRAEQ